MRVLAIFICVEIALAGEIRRVLDFSPLRMDR